MGRAGWLDRFYEAVEALDPEARRGSQDEWVQRLESIFDEAGQPIETVTHEDLRRVDLEHYAPLIGHPSAGPESADEQIDADLKALLEDIDPDLVAEVWPDDPCEFQDEEHSK